MNLAAARRNPFIQRIIRENCWALDVAADSVSAYHKGMTTFANSLKAEIARVARKELREEISLLRKTSAAQRSAIAVLKKEIKELQGRVALLSRAHHGQRAQESAVPRPQALAGKSRGKPGRKVIFSAERLKAARARLGFTQLQMAQLLGVSALSLWKWESGAAAPRASRVPQILERLALGKREALALLKATDA